MVFTFAPSSKLFPAQGGTGSDGPEKVAKTTKQASS
jgi:hypothetical protein